MIRNLFEEIEKEELENLITKLKEDYEGEFKESDSEFLQRVRKMMKDNSIQLEDYNLSFSQLERLDEAKADEQRFIDFAGEELARRFYAQKQRMQGQEKDIYYWIRKNDVDALEARVSELENKATKKQQNDTAREGAEVVAENNNYTVYHITTYEASVKYGKGAQWCISGSRRWASGLEEGRRFWNNYKGRGIEFYFFIPKTDEHEKYALAFYPNHTRQIFNATDNTVRGIPGAPNVEGIYMKSVSRSSKRKDLPHLVNARQMGYVFDTPNDYIIEDNIVTEFRRKDTKGTAIIPEGITGIEDLAFIYRVSLNEVIIPKEVEYIGVFAFKGCNSLTIKCEAESQPAGWVRNWNPDKRPVEWGFSLSEDEIEDDNIEDVNEINHL